MAHDPYVRWSRLLALAVVVLAALPAAPTAPATAADEASITRTGWWTRNPAASAPEGGLDVGLGPDGQPLSVAAIEVAASGTVTRAVLTLVEAGGIAQDGAALVVCTTDGEWTSGAGQPLEDAPPSNCERKVTMTRNGASLSWAADVTPLLEDVARDGAASLMVVPVASASAPLGFDVQFAPPRLQSEVRPTASPTPTSTTSPTTTTTTPPAGPPTTAPPSPPQTTGSDGYDPAVAAAGRAAATSTTTATPPVTVPPPSIDQEVIDAIMAPRELGPTPSEDETLPDPWWQLALAFLAFDLLLLGRQRASMGTKSRRSGPA